MELKLNIIYQQVFNLLKQLPVAEWEKLRGEIDKELSKKGEKKGLEKDNLLIRAKNVSAKVKKNELTMNDIVKEVKKVRIERYEK
ncbi:MAG: hypothetical protein FVQ77_00725 [Cytophagales bacterium]|nr:hypothetical protein [Cytophagales bacterium]